MEDKLTIAEMGIEAQAANPDVYGGMTGLEAGNLFLENEPDYWTLVREEDAGEEIKGGYRDTIGNKFTRMSGFGGIADDLAAMRPGQPLMGRISLGMQEAVLRAPGSLIDESVNTYDALINNTAETWQGVKDIGEGLGRSAVRNLGTKDDSILGRAIGQTGGPEFSADGPPTERHPTEQMASAVMSDMQSKLLDPEEWIRNPGGNALMASGLFPTPASVPKWSALVNAANPTILALKGGRGAYRAVKGAAKMAGREYPGLLTGRGAEAISEAYKAVRSADPKIRAAYYKYVSGNNSLLNFHMMAKTALETAMDKRSADWQKIWPDLKLRRAPEGIHRRIRVAVRDVLSDFQLEDVRDLKSPNFTRIGVFDVAEQNVIQTWLNAVDDPSAFTNAAGKLDVGSFDLLRKATWQASRHLEHDRVGRKMVERAYGKIRDVLEENIEGGYGDMLNDWKKYTELIGDFEAASGTRAGGYLKREQLGRARISAVRNLIRGLKDDPAGSATRDIINQMSEATGVPILPAAAGALFNNWVGSGLISRSELSGLMNMVTQGAVLHGFGINPFFVLLQAPLVSPKIVGHGIIPVLGTASRHKDTIMNVLNSIHSKVPEGWDTAGMTYWQAAQRLTEEQNVKIANGGFVPIYWLEGRKPQVGDELGDAETSVNQLSGGIK